MQITALYRHPIKSHGRETLDTVTLAEGQSMPFDRQWAIAHDAANVEDNSWGPCTNFSRGSKAPRLAAINIKLDESTGKVTLTHPDRPTVTLSPDEDAAELIDWVMPLVPQNRALPAEVRRLDARGFTDTPYPSVSLCNTASHGAIESLAMTPLSPLRWRGNIWFEGASPWVEHDWIGKTIQIGDVALQVEEPTVRCLATTANPDTGERDVDTLHFLNVLGHQNFGVYARVTRGGQITLGDQLEVI